MQPFKLLLEQHAIAHTMLRSMHMRCACLLR